MNKYKFLLVLIFIPFITGYTVRNEEVSVVVGDVEVPVYNVEVTWDSMKFIYTETVNYVWDEKNYTYELTDSTYKWNTASNKVKIINKSTSSVNVELKYIGEKEAILGSFDISKKTLAVNESILSKLSLNGELSSNNTDYIKTGTINLLIS